MVGRRLSISESFSVVATSKRMLRPGGSTACHVDDTAPQDLYLYMVPTLLRAVQHVDERLDLPLEVQRDRCVVKRRLSKARQGSHV
eukprot:scaffold31061_cov36-Phaeocystis_antarctica.AAC.1